MPEFKAHFKSAQPDLGGSLPGNLIFGIPGKDGGYYLVAAEQVDANTVRFTFTPSQDGMLLVDPVDISIPGATDEQIQKIVLEYLAQNPPTVEEKDPTVPDWAKQPQKPTYTASEVGAQPKGDYALRNELPEIPDALPNPKKLTFTGSVSAEYDGSKSVEIKIPEGGQNVNGLSDAEKVLMLTLFRSIEYTADVSAIITELENLWGGDSSGGESGGDTGGDDTEALYPLTNASHVFDNSLIATVSDGNHVNLSASSAITATQNNQTLYVNLSSLSQNGTATNSGNVSLGTTELFTLPGGSEVVLTLKNVVSNGVTLGANGYSVALRDVSKTYLKIQNATDFTEQTASKTPEANATIYNVFLFFCGTFEEGATMSFDIELTVDGERWI